MEVTMIIFNGETRFNIDNKDAIVTVLQMVSDQLKKNDTVFSHLIVNGVEVYENHEAYMEERLNQIEEITIVIKTVKEMIWETMQSIHEYLNRAIPALQELIDSSYETFTSATWKGINQLAEGMQWILQFHTFTSSASEKPANWLTVQQSITQCENSFKQMIEGVEAQDTILISDILSYEILPSYESLYKALEKSLQHEEFLKNAH